MKGVNFKTKTESLSIFPATVFSTRILHGSLLQSVLEVC